MEYEGDLKGFPREVVEKMLERQLEQGNKRDISVFEEPKRTIRKTSGFNWNVTKEGWDFWYKVINNKNFDIFFERYPKKTFPRVMIVSDHNQKKWHKRVVFMEKKSKYLAWADVETIEEAENVATPVIWEYAKEIEEKPSIEIIVKINGKEAKLSDISEETLSKLRSI